MDMEAILVNESDIKGFWPGQIEEDKSILKIETYLVVSEEQKKQLIEEISRVAPSYSNGDKIPFIVEGKDNKKIVFHDSTVTVMDKEEYLKEFPYDPENDYE